jgi:hypothetical protein
MLQAATARRQDELSAQVLALVQAISTLTVGVEDMATHRVQEQLLRPAARAIEARKPDENEMLVQTSGEQLHVDHRPSVSDLEASDREQESARVKLEAFARVSRKLQQKAAFHGLCKAIYLRKVSNFDWMAISLSSTEIPGVFNPGYSQRGIFCGVFLQKFAQCSKSAPPPAVWVYYGRYGTSHGSAAIKKPSPKIPRASKKTAQQKGE